MLKACWAAFHVGSAPRFFLARGGQQLDVVTAPYQKSGGSLLRYIRRSLFPASFLALAGCQPGAQFVALDAQTAMAVANAAGLTQDAQCWQAYASIAGVLGPAAPAAAPTGILTVIETKRAIQATMASPMCISVTAQLASELLKLSSPQGAAIGTLLGF